MMSILLISGEKEACSETVSFVISSGHCAGNGGLSRPSHPVQPKDVFIIRSIGPCLNLIEDVGSGAWETCGVMPAIVGVESGLRSGW